MFYLQNYFEHTVMYYGYYTDQQVHVVGDSYYDMKYAYLFTCGGYYILCLIILALRYLFIVIYFLYWSSVDP